MSHVYCSASCSAMRAVPANIEKPEYWAHGNLIFDVSGQASPDERKDKIVILTPKEIAGSRKACQLSREVLDITARNIKVGITTDELDAILHKAAIERGCYPSPLNYKGFPKSCCTSVNEVICHGIPDARPLQDGDILNIDVSLFYKGYHGDLNETYCVGNVSDEYKRLIKVSYDSLQVCIPFIKPGAFCRDFGKHIESHVNKYGYAPNRTYCGHGVHKLFHCSPNVPHHGNNRAVGVLKPGTVFTIEPMINQGRQQDETWPDEWTAVTVDGKRSAQFEHTFLCTEDGVEILTARTKNSPKHWWEVASKEDVERIMKTEDQLMLERKEQVREENRKKGIKKPQKKNPKKSKKKKKR